MRMSLQMPYLEEILEKLLTLAAFTGPFPNPIEDPI